jgi:hypothetical protein
MNQYKIIARVPEKSWLFRSTALTALNESEAITKAKKYLNLSDSEPYQFEITSIQVHKLGTKLQVENYPYGRLKTTAFFSCEYVNGKGTRDIFQTINPKTGRLNAEKKSTYSPVLLNCTDLNTGHIKTIGTGFNGHEDINCGLYFMQDFKDYFSPEQINDICLIILMYLKVDIKAQVIYAGSDFEALKPLYTEQINNIVRITKGESSNFLASLLDIEKIEAQKVPNYQPFKVTSSGPIY